MSIPRYTAQPEVGPFNAYYTLLLDDPEGKLVLFDELAEKVADLVRDAFYDGCETMQTWNGTLGPMSQDELFAAWMASEARKQLISAFPTLTNSVRSA